MYKKLLAFALVFTLLMSCLPGTSAQAESTTAKNPIIWADVPDVDVIRVNDTYYMTSTTMHMSPGVPIMKSKDLVNWEIVNYVYDILAAGDKQTLSNGQNIYGQGSWASSIRYHDGKFYVVFASNDIGKTYIFQTTDIEKGPWVKHELAGGVYHDMSLLFDDDGRVYLVYGNGTIKIIELTSDATAIKEGGMNKTIIQNASAPGGSNGLGAEGSHIYKINGKYYIFNISWPSGSIRTELVHRADTIDGTYEGKIALRSGSNSNSAGVAQGGIVQAPDGKWYGMLFQDYGSVGRIPYIVPMTWSEDGWPVFGDVNDTGIPAELSKSWVSSDDFDQRSEKVAAYHTEAASGENDYNGSNLGLVWQWNHNPDNRFWSLTDRPGYLRLTTGRKSTDILDARNTLTQRTFGPESSGTVSVDVSHMKDGDYAGIAAFQKNYGFVGVKMSGTTKSVVMVNGSSGTAVELADVPLTQNTVYLRTELDFKNRTDKAYFYYSLDGEHWASIGNTLQMSYTLPHFMGYRFALFNFATKSTGGYVDFDYFKLDDKLSGSNFDTNLKSLQVNGSQVSGFNPSIYTYSLDVPAGSTIPQVTAVANDSDASVTITQATALPGKATVTVSRAGLQTTVYTINFDTPVMVAIEAEKAAENTADAYVSGTANGHTWSLVDGQSTKAMQFVPDDGTSVTQGTDAASLAAGSKLGYKIDFPTTGTYNVWVLAKSHSYQTDSIHVGLDNQYKFTSNGIQGVSNGEFKWVNLSNGGTVVTGGTTLNITAGMHELNFWGRESGLVIDRIYVTTSNSTADPVWPSNTTGAILQGPAEASKGAAFELNYGLSGMNQNVYAQDLTFTYDPGQLEFVSAESVNPDEVVIVDKAQKEGEVRFIAATIGQNALLDGSLLKLHWKVKSDTQASAAAISLSRAVIANEAGIESELESKAYTIQLNGDVIDKTTLLALITDAQSKYDAATEGTGTGQYPAGSKALLQAAIDQAQAVADNQAATQEQVEQAVSALTVALTTFMDSVITTEPGDVNSDGRYSVGDLAIVAAAYGKTSADPNWSSYKSADLNNNGKIDIEDLAAVARKMLDLK